MDIDESNPDDFPEVSRAATKEFFLRMTNGINFLQIFKRYIKVLFLCLKFSLTLSNSSLVLFVCGGDNADGITIMTEYQKCIQGCCTFSKSCFEEAIIPQRVFKFAVASNDIQEAISMMPGSSVELSCIDEGKKASKVYIVKIKIKEIH